jgi:hypothetical protein
MALIAAQGATAPSIVASPANVTFAMANLAQLKPKMDAGRRHPSLSQIATAKAPIAGSGHFPKALWVANA